MIKNLVIIAALGLIAMSNLKANSLSENQFIDVTKKISSLKCAIAGETPSDKFEIKLVTKKKMKNKKTIVTRYLEIDPISSTNYETKLLKINSIMYLAANKSYSFLFASRAGFLHLRDTSAQNTDGIELRGELSLLSDYGVDEIIARYCSISLK